MKILNFHQNLLYLTIKNLPFHTYILNSVLKISTKIGKTNNNISLTFYSLHDTIEEIKDVEMIDIKKFYQSNKGIEIECTDKKSKAIMIKLVI